VYSLWLWTVKREREGSGRSESWGIALGAGVWFTGGREL
jgi:hypothetical protein